MVKALSVFKRRAGMPVEEFQGYWRSRHPDVVRKLPGIRRYVQSHTRPAAYQRGEPVYDGVAEVWFEDTASPAAFRLRPRTRPGLGRYRPHLVRRFHRAARGDDDTGMGAGEGR